MTWIAPGPTISDAQTRHRIATIRKMKVAIRSLSNQLTWVATAMKTASAVQLSATNMRKL